MSFCTECGTKNQDSAKFCQQCGVQIALATEKPQATIPAALAAAHDFQEKTTPAPEESLESINKASRYTPLMLWNPVPVALWGLLLSPLFSAWLTRSNWLSLGKPVEAKRSLILMLAIALILLFVVIMFGDKLPGYGLSWGLFGLWYLLDGMKQYEFVEKKLLSTYTKRPWVKVILLGAVCMAAFYFFMGFVGIATGSISVD